MNNRRGSRSPRFLENLRRSLAWVLVIPVAVLFWGSAAAGSLEEGTYELQFDFSLVDTSTGSHFAFAGGVGYLLTEHHQVGPVLSYTRDDPDGGATLDGFGLGGFYNYNFSTIADQLVPYAGVQLEYFGGDFGDLYDTGFQLYGGLRVMPGAHAAVNLKLFYDTKTGSGGVEDLDSTGVSAGLSIFF